MAATVHHSICFRGRDLKALAEQLNGINAKIISLDGALLSSLRYEKKEVISHFLHIEMTLRLHSQAFKDAGKYQN